VAAASGEVCAASMDPNLHFIFNLILVALEVLIVVDVVLSWVMPDNSKFPRSLTTQITDPLYAPIRAILQPSKMGGLDLSPMIVLLLIQMMQRMLKSGSLGS
jgi:YggT family protein